ncbi:FAD binding domain-containing protein, partial [Pseudomonas aeruginosa]
GERRVAFADFHRLPADTPERDNCLAVDELVTAIELPAPRFARHCHYLKVRDRASYAFALVSVAAALEPDGERIGELRLALGGVAHKPWRVAELEERFRGHPANRDSYVRFAEALLRDARPLAHNAFKIGLARNAIVRALEEAHSGGIGQ